MTDQHQPAAAAPRLSPVREAEIREWQTMQEGVFSSRAQRELLAELDATRADLARTRAEAAALRVALEHAKRAECELLAVETIATMPVNDGMRILRATAALGRTLSKAALAAPHSEPQPAAPVAPSAEAKYKHETMPKRSCRAPYVGDCTHARGKFCHMPRGHGGAHVTSIAVPGSYDDAAAWPQLAATTPPDHQAGDEHGE